MKNYLFTLSCLEIIQRTVARMESQRSDLFAVFSAVAGCDRPADAYQSLAYPSQEAFAEDYHNALEHLIEQLRANEYPMPGDEADSPLDERISWELLGKSFPSSGGHAPVPSQEVVQLWYRGHILHEAILRFRRLNRAGILKLWERFPERRVEIEIAYGLVCREAGAVPASGIFADCWKDLAGETGSEEIARRIDEIWEAANPESSAPDSEPGKSEYIRRAAAAGTGLGLIGRTLSSLWNTVASGLIHVFAGIVAVGIALVIAFQPPAAYRALEAVSNSIEFSMLSVQGIFNFSEEALKEEEPPGGPEPEEAKPLIEEEPEEEPREIELPSQQMAELFEVPDVPRELDIDRPSIGRREVPQIAGPQRGSGSGLSNYFGDRPDVQVVPRGYLTQGRKAIGTPGPIKLPASSHAPVTTEPFSAGEYRSAGRIKFSDFQASRSLAGELPRLIRIERVLSSLRHPRSLSFEGAIINAEAGSGRISFQDGVVFVITYTSGRLEDIRIYLKSDLERKLLIEDEALRGIRMLARVLR